MHGLKHRTQRFHRGYTTTQALARQGDYDARVKNNLCEARIIAFETSPHRFLSRHAYKNALYGTRRLVASSFTLRKEATKESHHAAVNKIDALLLTARDHAMVKSFDISIAQDVFVLISHYLGLTAVPEEPTRFSHASPFGRHRSFIAEKVHDGKRKFTRARSLQTEFTKKSTSLISMDPEGNFQGKLPRSGVSLSDLEGEYVEEIPIYVT